MKIKIYKKDGIYRFVDMTDNNNLIPYESVDVEIDPEEFKELMAVDLQSMQLAIKVHNKLKRLYGDS